jgi:hypothetical protein
MPQNDQLRKYAGFHVTAKGNGQKIIDNDFKLIPGTTNLFGRGHYFWAKQSDADLWASDRSRYPNGVDIIESTWECYDSQVRTYDHNKRGGKSTNQLAKDLLAAGVKMLIIPNGHMEEMSMQRASDRAFLLLRDASDEFNWIDHIFDIKNHIW